MLLNGTSSVFGNILTRTCSSLTNALVHSGVREVTAARHDILLFTHFYSFSLVISDKIILNGPSSVAEKISDGSVSGHIFSSLSNALVYAGVREASAAGHNVLFCTHIFLFFFFIYHLT